MREITLVEAIHEAIREEMTLTELSKSEPRSAPSV